MADRFAAGTEKVTKIGSTCAMVISSVWLARHEVADLHREVAGAPVDRRADDGVVELHLHRVHRRLLSGELRPRAFDRRAVGLHRPGNGVGAGARLLGDVLRDDAFLGERGLALRGERGVFGLRPVAAELGFGLAEQRLIAQQVGLGLPERRLERPLDRS